MLKIFLVLYIALTPFLHALTPLPIIALNSLILVMALPFAAIGKRRAKYNFNRDDLMLGTIWAYGVVAWLWYPVEVQQDRWQVAIQWAYSFFVLWIGVRRWLISSNISFDLISKVCFFSAIFLSLASIAEFFLVNTTGLFFSNFIYYSVEKFTDANIFGTTLYRPRVFSAEAGFTSMVFELFIPLSIPYFLKCRKFIQFVFLGLCLLGIFSLFSMASILSGLSAVLILYSVKKNNGLVGSLTFSLFAAVLIVSYSGVNLLDLPFYKVTEFFELSNYYLSEGTRQEALAAGWMLVSENPVGTGWGTVLQEAKIPGSEIDRMILGSGLISLWLELAVAAGIMGALALGYLVLNILISLLRVHSLAADSCFVCLCSLTLHHFAVYEVWFPMFWFALALAQVVIAETAQQNSSRHNELSSARIKPVHARWRFENRRGGVPL